jgi:hypothetical protein
MRNKRDPTMGWKARTQGKRHNGKTWKEWIHKILKKKGIKWKEVRNIA